MVRLCNSTGAFDKPLEKNISSQYTCILVCILMRLSFFVRNLPERFTITILSFPIGKPMFGITVFQLPFLSIICKEGGFCLYLSDCAIDVLMLASLGKVHPLKKR